MNPRNIKLLIVGLWVALLAHLALGQSIMSTAIKATWEPRNIGTKAGLVASHDPGNMSDVTLNGVGVSIVADRARSIRTGNLLLQSETFATTWTTNKIQQFGATDTGDLGAGSFANTTRVTDPLGANTADFIQEDNTATTQHYISQVGTISNGSCAYSVWVQSAGRTWVRLVISIGADSLSCYFQLSGVGTVGTSANGGSASGAVGTISAVGSWYLCKLTGYFPTDGSSIVTIRICDANNSSTYNGDGTSGLFIWGASLVASDWTQVTGPTLAQGYQVTTTAPYAPPNIIQPTAAAQPLISRTDSAGNLLKQSETFQTTWALTRCNAFGVTDATNTLNSGSFPNTARVTDPLGGNTADFVQEDSSASTTHICGQTTASIPTGNYTASACVKDGGRTWVRLRVSGSATYGAYFDVANGAIGAVAGSPTLTNMVSLVNGWYLCQITFPWTAGAFTLDLRLASGDGGESYSGDGTKGLFLWGSSLVATNWLPVTGTTAALGYVATTTQPVFPGLAGRSVMYFDGAASYLKSGYGNTFTAFPLVQPEEVYLATMQWTWTLNRHIWDGFGTDTGSAFQRASSPNIGFNAGASIQNGNLAVGSWGVVRMGYSGANSYSVVNDTSAITGDTGAANMGAFTLGAQGNATTWANVLVARSLICNKTNAPAEANYLAWGLKKQTGVY